MFEASLEPSYVKNLKCQAMTAPFASVGSCSTSRQRNVTTHSVGIVYTIGYRHVKHVPYAVHPLGTMYSDRDMGSMCAGQGAENCHAPPPQPETRGTET